MQPQELETEPWAYSIEYILDNMQKEQNLEKCTSYLYI